MDRSFLVSVQRSAGAAALPRGSWVQAGRSPRALPERSRSTQDQIRIAYLAGTLARGGAERELVNQLKALRGTRWDPLVFSFTVGEPIEAEIRALGVPVIPVSRKGGILQRALRVAWLARQHRVSLIHSQHFFANPYSVAVHRIAGIPGVGSIQSNVHAEVEQLGAMGKPSLFGPRWMTVNSRPAYETAVQMGRSEPRTFLLENGLDLAEFGSAADRASLPWDPRRPLVIGVGSLGPAKRFDRFVEVIARVRAQVPTVQAVIVGEGPLRGPIEQAASDRGLLQDGTLRLLGQRTDVQRLLPQADVFLFTSDYEGFPNAVQEALASGLPVVSTRIGAVPDIVENGSTGLLCEREDVDGLAEGVSGLLLDPLRRKRMARRGVEHAHRRFGLPRLAQDLDSIYASVLRLN
jgi:glycosyltransferase involved in cell wall biosynthesis